MTRKNDAIGRKTDLSAAPEASVSIDQIIERLWQRPGFLLRRCLQHTSGAFEQSCSELGLTARQYDYLFVLDMAGEMGQTELAGALGLDRSTNTLVLKILERKQFVKRKIVANDTRKRLVSITDHGRSVSRQAHVAAGHAIQSLTNALDAGEYQQLIDLLQKVVRANSDQSYSCQEPSK
ncbi:MarR family winged helix-turn-helix transcriptional regulator [Candidimonas nitroreducens]|nr:MarR family winged helix-turn-helix transcriptional regulator [Candidimonas nitroreducens]